MDYLFRIRDDSTKKKKQEKTRKTSPHLLNLFSSISSVEPKKDQNFISDDSFQLKSRERLNELVIEIQSHRELEIIEDRRVFLIQPDDKIDFILEA